jgi:hypothetical protein
MNDGAYWGVDSYNPVNSPVWHAKGKHTLFEFVCEQAGRVPDFWGRYITGNGEKIKRDEADYIFTASKGATRILPIYNQAGPNPHSLKGTAREGALDAHKAIAAASALGIPGGVFLWCDIEPGWGTHSEWYDGWWNTMFASPYGGMGGIYENPLSTNASFFAAPYLKALKATPNGSSRTRPPRRDIFGRSSVARKTSHPKTCRISRPPSHRVYWA